MAKVISDTEFQERTKHPGGPGRKALYPWETWFDGKNYELELGVDFKCKTESMVTQVYSAATTAGLEVTVSKQANGNLLVKSKGPKQAEAEAEKPTPKAKSK